MAESSKRIREGAIPKSGSFDIPWYANKRLPSGTILYVTDGVFVGIKIKNNYHKVEGKEIAKATVESISADTEVTLNTAVSLTGQAGKKKIFSWKNIRSHTVTDVSGGESRPKAILEEEEVMPESEEKPSMDVGKEKVESKKRKTDETEVSDKNEDGKKVKIDGQKTDDKGEQKTDSEQEGHEIVEGDPSANNVEEENGEINEIKQAELPAQGSEPPKEKLYERQPVPDAKGRAITGKESILWGQYQDYMSRIHDARLKGDQGGVDEAAVKALEYEEKFNMARQEATLPNQSDDLKEVMEDEEEKRQKEETTAKSNAVEGAKQVDSNQTNPVTDLAMGEANGTTPMDSTTGHGNTATTSHNTDVKITTDVDTNTPGKVNEDVHMVDKTKENPTGEVLSAEVLHEENLLVENIAGSGNDEEMINNIGIEGFDPTPKQEERQQAFKETETMDVTKHPTDERTDEHNRFINEIMNVGKLKPTPKVAQGVTQEQIDKAEAEKIGSDVSGFEEHMGTLQRRQLIKSALDPAARQRELDALRQLNKLSDATTGAMLTDEQLQAVIDKDAIEKQRTKFAKRFSPGQNPLGTPVFAPDDARSHLHEAQRTVMTHLTETEAVAIRKGMAPLWDEFKLSRLNAGVVEMSVIPTRVLKSDKSTLKAASKIREDISQREESFGNFMFWLLHHRFDTKGVSWGNFLNTAAALGYNDLTKAQINWLITGNPNGDLHEHVDFSRIEDSPDVLDERIEVTKEYSMRRRDRESLRVQIESNPEPQTVYPSRSLHPSAGPVDNSTHPDGSTSLERQQKSTLKGIPSSVINIPDPKFSMRGGEAVENVRTITVRNEKWDPNQTAKEGEEGYEPKFTTMKVPDIGVGSKDIQAKVNQASADRLLDSMPQKLYAPIHPQACDRYLGKRNYQRLNLENTQYLKEYSQHPFSVDSIAEMYAWNSYIMGLYGPTLYSNVTDIQMQRTAPVFMPQFPDSVIDEYKELNELIKELERYQDKSIDRAEQITGGSEREEDRMLNDHFTQRQIDDLPDSGGDIDDTDLYPDSKFPSKDEGTGTDDTGKDDDDDRWPGYDPNDPRGKYQPRPVDPNWDPPGGDETIRPIHEPVHINNIKNTRHPLVGPLTMERGVVRSDSSRTTLHHAVSKQALNRAPIIRSNVDTMGSISDMDRRNRMFSAFQRR